MAQIDPRVDAYIAKAQPFAKPILEHIRAVIHATNPDVVEAIKWGMPAFIYKGKNLAGIASFKAHATLGFWSGNVVAEALGKAGDAMGSFGRITSLADLPGEEALREMIAKASALIDAGSARGPKRKPRPELPVPPALDTALNANLAARAAFDAFPPSARREYVEWIIDAKRDETRAKRLAQAVEWIAEGKKRNWKYENC